MSLIRPSKQLSLDYAKKLAERWNSGAIPTNRYYYLQASECIAVFKDYLSDDHYSLLAGLVEYYNLKK